MAPTLRLLYASGACLAGAVVAGALWQSTTNATTPKAPTSSERVAGVNASRLQAEDNDRSAVSELFPVTVRRPSGPPRIELAGVDPQGRTGSVACSTCHSVRPPDMKNTTASSLDEFHKGMTFNHGKVACYGCHNPNDADTLRLADGSPVAYEDVMTLCSQCHGPQATAFAHGAHGGMNGYWDRTRGPQTKNNCVDCHDPHAPSYPKMVVGFKPRDRFNEPDTHDQQGAAEHDDH